MLPLIEDKYLTANSKGQVVIPNALRKKFGIDERTPLFIREYEAGIFLQPMTKDYFSKMSGFFSDLLKDKKNLVKDFIKEKRQRKKGEDKKWLR